MSDYSNDLIYGANKETRVVSVEAKGDTLILFKEAEDGSVFEEYMNATYWVATNRKISEKQDILEGKQHYKYLARFETPEEMKMLQDKLYQKRLDFYRIYDPKECNLVLQGITYFKGLSPKDVSILSFDIETTGLTHDENSKVLLISNTFRRAGTTVKRLFAYDDYATEADMFDDWCSFVRSHNPAILAGHNIFGFDLLYMQYVANRAGTTLRLGRDGSAIQFNKKTSKKRASPNDIEYFNALVFGREIVDTMFLSMTYDFAKKYTSYGLKSIIKEEGLEKQDRVFYDAGQIRYKYKDPEEWAKIKAYAIDDADDALALFDLMIPAYFYFTQSVSKSFQQMINSATGSQINNMMVRSYLQEGHSVAKATEVEPFEGAISFGIAGLYRNAVKLDVASLYPSVMRAFKIFDKAKDPKEYFSAMVEYFTLERLKNKKLAKETKEPYYNDMQESQKIAINSMYGFLGATGLNYNSPANAALVTRKGRELLGTGVMMATGVDIEVWRAKVNE